MAMARLMPGTAREQAGKLGVGYDGDRLTSDPNYNPRDSAMSTIYCGI